MCFPFRFPSTYTRNFFLNFCFVAFFGLLMNRLFLFVAAIVVVVVCFHMNMCIIYFCIIRSIYYTKDIYANKRDIYSLSIFFVRFWSPNARSRTLCKKLYIYYRYFTVNHILLYIPTRHCTILKLKYKKQWEG